MNPLDAIADSALPGVELQALYDWILQFMLLSLRIGSFLLSSPVFGSRTVVVTVRIVVTFMLTLSLVGRVDVPQMTQLQGLAIVTLVTQEILIGLCAGMMMSILFSSVALAGEKISSTSGLSFATQIDPNAGGTTPAVSQILTMFLTVIFLSLNGHLIAIMAVIKSYESFPMGSPLDIAGLLSISNTAMGEMFEFSAKMMLPIVSVITLINIAIGVVTRSAPTLNLFSFGFPITLLAVFVVMFLSVPHLAFSFSDLSDHVLLLLQQQLSGLGNE